MKKKFFVAAAGVALASASFADVAVSMNAGVGLRNTSTSVSNPVQSADAGTSNIQNIKTKGSKHLMLNLGVGALIDDAWLIGADFAYGLPVSGGKLTVDSNDFQALIAQDPAAVPAVPANAGAFNDVAAAAPNPAYPALAQRTAFLASLKNAKMRSKGHIFDGGVKFGYVFAINDAFSATPVVGYDFYDHKHNKMKAPDSSKFQAADNTKLNTFADSLNLKTKYHGPSVGLKLSFKPADSFGIDLEGKYIFARVTGSYSNGGLNLINNLPGNAITSAYSVKKSKWGHGFAVAAGLNFDINDSLILSGKFGYRQVKAKLVKATATVKEVKAKVNAWEAGLGLTYAF